jgi:protease-4
MQVAKGRNKTEAEVSEIAQGRVWLGSTALKLGLVDKLGGEKEAIQLAKLEARLPTEVTHPLPPHP